MKQIANILILNSIIFLLVIFTFGQDEKSKNCSVILEVEFLKTGKVGEISISSSDCDKDSGLERKAIEAAQVMKFEPQIKDGKAVKAIKKVRYDFRIADNENSADAEGKLSDISDSNKSKEYEKAEAVIAKAIQKLGGEKYQNVQNSVGEGKLSLLNGGRIVSYQSFTDVMIYPNKERTDFSQGGSKSVQVNIGEKGWYYDESLEKFADQNEIQIDNFKQSLRSHYNYLLRGDWEGNATMTYQGRRPASLGKRNDVIRLTFEDGFEVEFEFSDEGLPMKTLYTTYKTKDTEKIPVKEENRYAQYVYENGIYTPYVIDHFIDDKQAFRVNYKSMNYNKRISDEIFAKPEDPKKLKKLKF